MYSVFIPYTNEAVFYRQQWKTLFHRDVQRWIFGNLGKIGGGLWSCQRGPEGATFKFMHPEHAMMFKLTWGGR